MRTIPLYKSVGSRRWGQRFQVGETLVDDEDYERFSVFQWNMQSSKGDRTFYARRAIYSKQGTTVFHLHREIMGLGPFKEDPREVDHWDHNGLNNQKINLRVVDKLHNHYNRLLREDSTSGFPGVRRYRGKWRLLLQVGGKERLLGTWASKDDAAYASYYAINLLRGEFGNPGSIEGLSVDQEKIEAQVRERLKRHSLLPPGMG
jgi:hypothetical protein